MYKIILKEIKSLFRQLQKTNKIVQLLVAGVVLYVLWYFFNPTQITYSLNQLSILYETIKSFILIGFPLGVLGAHGVLQRR